MPRSLPDELLEEVLRRLPPDEPSELVRAALVSKRWCRLVSDPGFRRRFREFHRSPSVLGMLCNHDANDVEQRDATRFVPTTAFCTPRTDFRGMRVLDSRHGRVLFLKGVSDLVVWDPIKNEVVRELPFPQKKWCNFAAAILCPAVACDHLDCHQEPSFLIVYVCSDTYYDTAVYTFSSDAYAWSEPIHAMLLYIPQSCMSSALVGNSLYFGNRMMRFTALKYDLELCQLSLILLPALRQEVLKDSLLTTTEDGGLGLVHNDDSKLYLWSREDTHEVDAKCKWKRRVIELKIVFPDDVDVSKLSVFGSGAGIIIMRTGGEVFKGYTIDLNTNKVKKVYEGTAHNIVPYMSFYTPALKGTCTGEGPSVGHSRA